VRQAEQQGEPDADGWIRMKLRIEWPDEAPRTLLGMAADLEVLEPAGVREKLAGLAREVIARYGAPAASSAEIGAGAS
jgi:predicted DNA-binding transcriptional regulator YafY